MEQPLGMFSVDLFRRGRQYLEAFKVLSSHGDDYLRHPQYFLLAHALELILKAYLAAKGVERTDLFGIGHKIEELERRAHELGLPELEHFDRLVAELAEMNGEHDFRYPTGWNLTVPAPDLCQPIMDQLLTVVQPVVSHANLKAQFDFASDTRHLRGRGITFSDPPKKPRPERKSKKKL